MLEDWSIFFYFRCFCQMFSCVMYPDPKLYHNNADWYSVLVISSLLKYHNLFESNLNSIISIFLLKCF
jgi:hypothetical protein